MFGIYSSWTATGRGEQAASVQVRPAVTASQRFRVRVVFIQSPSCGCSVHLDTYSCISVFGVATAALGQLTIEYTGQPSSGFCQPITDGHLSTLSVIPSCFQYLMKNISDKPIRTNAAAVVSLVHLSCQRRLRPSDRVSAGLRIPLPPAIADNVRFSERADEYLVARRSTGVYALGNCPGARHGKEGGPKDRARRSPKTRTPSQAKFHPTGRC